ncbi:MAG: hypothetical protein CO183_00600 [Candidatus Zambryskibacteria bacterium CG_4_9_14_3_um_filter_42_9]|nr:MAG: hypothetical protein CO183_00600 [Candidatus Zambryskibacteria bacterium CG_4_9_14_3_um_filter_42_9]
MMRWKITTVLLVSLLITPFIIGAADPTELEKEIEQVQREREILIEEQKKLQVELEAVNKETRSLGSAVKSLDATKLKLAKDISITQSKITLTDLTIRSLESTVSEKEQQIFAHRAAIVNTILAFSDYDSRPLILELLSSSSLSDVWRDRSQLEGLSNRLEDEIGALRETRNILNLEKEQKERVKKEQLSLRGQLNGQKLVVDENKKAKEKLLIETKNVESQYQKMLALNIARQKEFEEDLFRLESELRIFLDPTLIPSSRPGLISWPLQKVFITQRFGRTSASGRLYASGTHNGVDFRATQGTPVMAVLGGVVEGTGNTDEQNGCGSYGRWILIKHPNGLTSIYAHLSASLVTTGKIVSAGEVIGYSGGMPGVFGSGYSTGPHLHLGLFASQGVSIRKFESSRGCKQVFVPIADIKAYLDPLSYLPSL